MVQNIRYTLSFIPDHFLFNNFYVNFNCGHWSIWDFIWLIFLLSPIWIHVEDIFQHVYNFKSSKSVGSFLKKLTWKSVVLNGIYLGPHKGIPRKNFSERNNWEELHNVQFSLKYSRLVESSALGNYSIILSHLKYFYIFFKSFLSFVSNKLNFKNYSCKNDWFGTERNIWSRYGWAANIGHNI